jgi:hypothetical protein
MNKELLRETLNVLFELEVYFNFDETKKGTEIGNLINKLQKEL